MLRDAFSAIRIRLRQIKALSRIDEIAIYRTQTIKRCVDCSNSNLPIAVLARGPITRRDAFLTAPIY